MAGFGTMADLIAAGQEFGIFEFYLPFVILFAIVYGLLMKSKIFGADKAGKNINLIIALAISLFVMVYTPAGVQLSTFLSDFFGKVFVVLVTILALLMMLGLLLPSVGVEMSLTKGVKIVVALVVLLAVGVFISSGGMALFPGIKLGEVAQIPINIGIGISAPVLAIIVVVVSLGLIIWYMTREEGGSGRKKSPAFMTP